MWADQIHSVCKLCHLLELTSFLTGPHNRIIPNTIVINNALIRNKFVTIIEVHQIKAYILCKYIFIRLKFYIILSNYPIRINPTPYLKTVFSVCQVFTHGSQSVFICTIHLYYLIGAMATMIYLPPPRNFLCYD